MFGEAELTVILQARGLCAGFFMVPAVLHFKISIFWYTPLQKTLFLVYAVSTFSNSRWEPQPLRSPPLMVVFDFRYFATGGKVAQPQWKSKTRNSAIVFSCSYIYDIHSCHNLYPSKAISPGSRFVRLVGCLVAHAEADACMMRRRASTPTQKTSPRDGK